MANVLEAQFAETIRSREFGEAAGTKVASPTPDSFIINTILFASEREPNINLRRVVASFVSLSVCSLFLTPGEDS